MRNQSIQAYDLEPGSRFEYRGNIFDVEDYDIESDTVIVRRRNASRPEPFNPEVYVTVLH